MSLKDAEFVQGLELKENPFSEVVCQIAYTSEGQAHYFPKEYSKKEIYAELEQRGYNFKRVREQTLPDINWGMNCSLTEDSGYL